MRYLGYWGLVLAVGSAAAPLAAQGAVAGGIEEQAVTAEKREQRLHDLPVSVAALPGDLVEALRLRRAAEVAAQTPNFIVGYPHGDRGIFAPFIRGVGLHAFGVLDQPPVATYLDDVYLVANAAQSFPLLDVERVEILRGPQGTLYGRNAMGGVVNVVSRKPDDTWQGWARAGVGTFGATELAGAIGGPVSDVVGLRAAVRKLDADGWLNNRFTGHDQNGSDELSWRLLAVVAPADAFAAQVRAHGGRNRSDSVQYRHLGVLAPESVALGGAAPCVPQRVRRGECVDAFGYSERLAGVTLAGEPYPPASRYDEGNYNFEGRHDSDFWGAALTIDAQLGGVAITAITGYDHVDDARPEDGDASPNDVLAAVLAVEQDTWSQELRISQQHEDWNWLVGIYYLRDEATDRSSLQLLQELRYLSATTQEITSLSMFADVGRALSERWSATLGLRYTDEEVEHDVALFVDQPLPGGAAARDFRNWSGRLVFDYRLDQTLNVYGGVSTGFQPAGLRTTAQGTFPYDEERLISYETGFNVIQAAGRVHLHGALFYYDYRDLQLFTPLPIDGLPVPIARDTADASVLGAELELQAIVDERMFVRLGVGYLDAEYRSFVSAGQRLSGNDLPLSPKLSFNALVQYQMPLNDNATLTWQGDVSYQDDVFFEARNDPLLRQGGYWMLNAQVTWRSAEHWEVAAWAHNVLNEEYLTSAFDLSVFGIHRQTLGAPRSFGVAAGYRF